MKMEALKRTNKMKIILSIALRIIEVATLFRSQAMNVIGDSFLWANGQWNGFVIEFQNTFVQLNGLFNCPVQKNPLLNSSQSFIRTTFRE